LFSGSFSKGLVTGLATSVDKSLRNAMDKRDEEMSSARRFWQTRQAQKLDLKEEHDRRATKALDRLIREADGDVALGLAAYQAAGNSPEDVEKYLVKIDAVRDAKGTFKLSDSLILPEGYEAGKVTVGREAAMSSVGMRLKGVDASSIAINDPLSKIGLGLKGGASQDVANKINSLVPPSEVTEVEGLSGVQLDMSKMLAAEQYAQDQAKYEKAMGPSNYDEAMFEVNTALSGIKRDDFETEDEFQAARNVQLEKRQGILKDIAAVAAAEEAAGNTGVSDSIMRVVWADTREQGRRLAGIGGKDESRYYTDKDGNYVPAMSSPEAARGYAAAVIAADKASAGRFVSAQRKDDGSFNTSALNIIGTDQHLKSAYAGLTGADAAEDTGVADEAPEDKFKSIEAIGTDQAGYAADIFTRMNDINNKNNISLLYRTLINSGATADEANTIISEAYTSEQTRRQSEEEKYSGFVMPGSGAAAGDADMEVVVADDGKKSVGNVSWSPDYAPSMTSQLRDKNIPASVREVILNDYVALMNAGGQSVTKEEAMTKFGIK
jgi:hypothetical protein